MSNVITDQHRAVLRTICDVARCEIGLSLPDTVRYISHVGKDFQIKGGTSFSCTNGRINAKPTFASVTHVSLRNTLINCTRLNRQRILISFIFDGSVQTNIHQHVNMKEACLLVDLKTLKSIRPIFKSHAVSFILDHDHTEVVGSYAPIYISLFYHSIGGKVTDTDKYRGYIEKAMFNMLIPVEFLLMNSGRTINEAIMSSAMNRNIDVFFKMITKFRQTIVQHHINDQIQTIINHNKNSKNKVPYTYQMKDIVNNILDNGNIDVNHITFMMVHLEGIIGIILDVMLIHIPKMHEVVNSEQHIENLSKVANEYYNKTLFADDVNIGAAKSLKESIGGVYSNMKILHEALRLSLKRGFMHHHTLTLVLSHFNTINLPVKVKYLTSRLESILGKHVYNRIYENPVFRVGVTPNDNETITADRVFRYGVKHGRSGLKFTKFFDKEHARISLKNRVKVIRRDDFQVVFGSKNISIEHPTYPDFLSFEDIVGCRVEVDPVNIGYYCSDIAGHQFDKSSFLGKRSIMEKDDYYTPPESLIQSNVRRRYD